MLERNSKLMTKKMIQYLIPSILMIFAMQFGSLIDGILVSNIMGNEALTATSLVLPVLFIAQLPGLAMGTGGSIVAANLLGKRDIKKAKSAFSICMMIGVGISLIFAILSFFISQPLAQVYCPDEAYAELGRQYIFIYLITDPIIVFTLILASFVGVDNNPRLASIMYIVANVVKVVTEFIFLKCTELGLYGAGLSTAVGYLAGGLLVIFYIKSKKRLLSFTFKFEEAKKGLIDSLKACSSVALNYGLIAVQMSICNIFIAKLIDPASVDILVFGVISNMVFVFDLILGGVIQVVPNICGVLYGEKDYFGLKKITRRLYFITVITSGLLIAVLAIFPGFYCQIFGFDASIDPDKVYLFIRIFVFVHLPAEISKFNQMYYPTIEKNAPAYVTIICRELVLAVPLTVVLLHTNGLLGYCIAQLATEIGSVIITYIFIIAYSKHKKLSKQGLFLIPSIVGIDKYDVTINNDPNNASLLSQEVEEYALKHGISQRNSSMIALGAEEMVMNIIENGYKIKNHHYYIDVTLKIVEDKMILTIKDDGIVFDPTQYHEEEKVFSTNGILLVQKIVDKISYARVLNTNNTSIEIYLKGAA